jgi:hypothetical protein
MSRYDVSEGLEVNGLAFWQPAAHRQRDLKGETRSSPAFWIATSMHKSHLKGDAQGYGKNGVTIAMEIQAFKRFRTASTF